jgi:hypothetical protein
MYTPPPKKLKLEKNSEKERKTTHCVIISKIMREYTKLC